MITDKLQVIPTILPVGIPNISFLFKSLVFFFLMRLRRNHYIAIYSIIGLKMKRVYIKCCINTPNSVYNTSVAHSQY